MNLSRTRHGRRWLLAGLYFAEGAPIGWLWWALPTRLRAAGVPLAEVTALTALLGLPWAFKFLWAPAVDVLRGRRWGLRAWVLSAQLGMALTLVPLLLGVDLTDTGVLAPILLAHAMCAATQDVAVDALAIRMLPREERGSANGWMQCGMLAGRGIFGGLSLWAERWIGVQGVVLALIGCCCGSGLFLLAAGGGLRVDRRAGEPDAGPPAPPLRVRLAGVGSALASLVRSRYFRSGLVFALLGGAGFEAVGGTAQSLLVDIGLAQARIGAFYALPVVLCMAAGALLGGRLADRRPRAAASRTALLAVSTSIVLLTVVVLMAAGDLLLLAALGLVYVCLGVFTACSYALFMDLCDASIAATQFSAFMGVTNLCEVGAVWTAGRLASLPEAGPTPGSYAGAWWALGALSLLALPALRVLRDGPSPVPVSGSDGAPWRS